MRTAIKLDPALLAEAKTSAAQAGRTQSDMVSDGLREPLARSRTARASRETFALPTGGRGGVRASVNSQDKPAMAELLDNDSAYGDAPL